MLRLNKLLPLSLAHWKCVSRPIFQRGSSIKLIRKFSWFKSTTIEPTSAVVTVTRSVFVTSPPVLTKYNQSGDFIIDLFTNTQLHQICKDKWKTDFYARHVYTMFYVKYHLYDTDPALKIMAQDINIYNDNHRNLGYYLTHLLGSHVTIAEQRQIMNHTLNDYDLIQPRRRL